ncbi:hypothetical protein GOBAR_AA19956 [Gossypium barbadense]|uniref:Uncharacterized protein n=1 Tax=Gossypium barbadense TaxID=3634 RepID=A0A2P5XBK1_GOSBA|nr:hypothetical protein GOBAR_AA19956 [Gossypium barbadense]
MADMDGSSVDSKEESSEDSKLDFSEDEETLIIRMFNLVGERWSLIAGRIPGRTAEEIQKYWASRFSYNNPMPNLRLPFSTRLSYVQQKQESTVDDDELEPPASSQSSWINENQGDSLGGKEGDGFQGKRLREGIDEEELRFTVAEENGDSASVEMGVDAVKNRT